VKATIRVDAKNETGAIDRRIYGHFIENMARCTYGGLLKNERPGDPRGPWKLREDLIDMVAELQPPVIRWPGGLFADGYNWRDGVGPEEVRPMRRNRYWSRYGPFTRVLDPNVFGSDEYMSLMRRVGAEPYVNVNFGTSSAAEAARWVEYMNGDAASTLEGGRRASYGREEPCGVKTWGIGNEMYGLWSLGHSRPDQYARRYLEFKGAMQEADGGLEYVAVGSDAYFNKTWNREVLSIAGDQLDLLSVHVYLPGPERIGGVWAARAMGGTARMYKAIVASPIEYERRLRTACGDIEAELGKESTAGIAFDEWNLWWSPIQLQVPRWTLRDALFACGVLHAMHRLSSRVKVANIAQLVNVLGLIITLGDRVCRTALYYPFLMYSRLAGSTGLETNVVCDSFETLAVGGIPAMTNVPVLDCSATASEDGKTVTLFAINRHASEPAQCRIEIAGLRPAGEVAVHTLNAPHYTSYNSYKNDTTVHINEAHVDVGDALPARELPAHSATAMVFRKG
jgi:alpha-N-arabinofuranosidase